MDEIISKHFPFTARCPTLTLVLDEMGCDDVTLEREASSPQVNLDLLKELRIILQKTPDWLNEIAQRSTCSSDEEFTIKRLVLRILGPVMAPIVALGSTKITIYLFRQLDSASMDALTAAIEVDLSQGLEGRAITGGARVLARAESEAIGGKGSGKGKGRCGLRINVQVRHLPIFIVVHALI
jgi:hypothetical protein